jgi:hypothetical protein
MEQHKTPTPRGLLLSGHPYGISVCLAALAEDEQFLAVFGGMGSGWENSVRSAMSIVTDASCDQPSSVRSGIEVRTPILQLRITSIAAGVRLDMPLLTELGGLF